MRHEILTAPAVAELLEQAEPGDDIWRRANLEEMRRLHAHATALPGELVEASTQATARCEMVWRTARENGDFAAILPHSPKCCALRVKLRLPQGKSWAFLPTTHYWTRLIPAPAKQT